MLHQEDLDELWDFGDPAGSETRLRAASAKAPDGIARAELLTQVARALGLQNRFEDATALLDELDVEQAMLDDSLDDQDHHERAAGRGVVAVCIALERGRVLNSSGEVGSAAEAGSAVWHFHRALDRARGIGADFLAIDALHMLAVADASHGASWAAQGLRLADAHPDPRTRRWAVALHTNRGWDLLEGGEAVAALAEFEAALTAAEAVGTTEQQGLARENLAECRAALNAED